MKKLVIVFAVFCFVFLLISCKQRISTKEKSLTGINKLSYTDVAYKSMRDTVLVSSFNGTITEVIKHNDLTKKRVIIDLNDEIYSLAYNYPENLIYASTLNKGIVVIDEQRGEIEKLLPIKNKWTTDISYNPVVNILLASGYTDNPYLWDVKNHYSRMNVPNELEKMQPEAISDIGTIYFDGNGVIGIWNIKKKSKPKILKLAGRISDVDNEGRVLALSDKKYILKNTISDSILIENMHPNWPIYVSSKDTTVRVPVNLPLTDAILSRNNIYSSSIDKSIRKWNLKNGELIEDLLGHKATISAISLSKDETQLVSVDLKGEIIFWNLENN